MRSAGGLHAHNTDPDGVAGALHAAGIAVNGKTCLVLGAGGAAAAAAYALHRTGGIVTIANRSHEHAHALALKINCRHCSLNEAAHELPSSKIIVNTIPADILLPHNLTKQHVVLDAVYPDTMLCKKVENAGGVYISGGQWLLHQAIPAYELFTEKKPNIEAMRMLTAMPFVRHVSLIGFMGAGKSSIAPLLGMRLGMRFVDIDKVVEEKCGAAISDIIGIRGEEYFRAMEHEALENALNSAVPQVIACGGGAISRHEMRIALHQKSTAIWLYSPVSECLRCIGDIAARPLLMREHDPMAAAHALFEKRIPLYAQTAWMLINTQDKSIEQTADIIAGEVGRIIPHF
jgi:shikimate dehydrogenase